MDQNDLKMWARTNDHQLGGALNQYLLGNRSLEESLVDVVDKLRPLRDTSAILRYIEDREADLDDDMAYDWGTWLNDLKNQVLDLSPTKPAKNEAPQPLKSQDPPEKPSDASKLRIGDVIQGYVDYTLGDPVYGLKGISYFARASSNVRIIASQNMVADPRRSGKLQVTDDYVLLPPWSRISIETLEKFIITDEMEVLVMSHPDYERIGVLTSMRICTGSHKVAEPLTVHLTNTGPTDAKIYLGHGFCEIRYLKA